MSEYGTDTGVRGLALRRVKARRTAMRVVMRSGHSLVIGLPLEFLKHLGLAKGDYVEMVLDEYSNRFYVKRAHTSTRTREPKPVEQLPLEDVR